MNWWQVVEDNWEDILDCIKQFHPSSRANVSNYVITAPAAEHMCEVFRESIKFDTSIIEAATLAKETKNLDVMYNILTETWIGAPESRDVFKVKGFNTICNLLEDV